MKKLFTFILTLFVASSVWAYDFKVDRIYYDVDEELNSSVRVTYKVQEEESYEGSITIPSSVTYDGKIYNVTSIGDSAFYDCELLTSVTIPNSVTSIGDCAFCYCYDLTSVTIPNSVTSIGEYAFLSCHNLTSVTIPNSVTSIGEYAFLYCHDALYNIKNELKFLGNAQNPYLVLVDVVDSDKLSTAIIPEGTKLIASDAFSSCHDLTSVTIPNSVTSIGLCAFFECTSLTSVTIPNSVTSIGICAFYRCTGLTSVTIPDGVTSIGNYAFCYCDALTSITIPSSVTSIGTGVFDRCSKLTSIQLDKNNQDYCLVDGVLYNEDMTKLIVAHKGELGAITIPNSVTCIENWAFGDCWGLTSITIPNSVTSIGDYAFYGCTSLTRVTNYAVKPQAIKSSTFATYYAYLYIPCDNFDAYDLDNNWGNFKHIECVSAEETVVTKDAVSVEPEISEAVFSMPTNASANSYTLTIQNNGVTFCTLTFNSQGQLANIDFSNSQLKAAVEGYQFTVTGLSAATGYNYSFKALDKSKSVLKEYTGSFTTKNADGTGGSTTTAIENVELANAISIINNQIFVNGEAPEFVITSLGQKVTNQNLKAGIYFVQVGYEMQGVAVK